MLTQSQARRYVRHTLLPRVGPAGQERLLAARVAVDRVDGAAAVTVLYLAAAGVGTLVVRDGGAVARAGFLFESSDVGRPVIDAVRARLAALNPDVHVVEGGDAAHVVGVAAGGDAMIDGSHEAARIVREIVKW